MATLVVLEMVLLATVVEEMISLVGVETGDGDLGVLVVVMLVLVEMTVAQMIGTTIWMRVDGDEDEEDSIIELILLIGAEAEVGALKQFEPGGVIAVVGAGAEVEAVAEAEVAATAEAVVKGVGAGRGVVVGVVVGATAVVVVVGVAIAVALLAVVTVVVAPVMKDTRGPMIRTVIRRILQFQILRLYLDLECLLCPLVHKSIHLQIPSLRGNRQWLRKLS